MANKAYKNLNCKIDKSVSDKLEKFIADTKLSKTATVEKALEEYINKYYKTGKRFNKKRQPLFRFNLKGSCLLICAVKDGVHK